MIHELVEKIAHREGIGDLLAEGVARAHKKLGVENWSVEGMEFAAHDRRVINGQGFSYAVANRGADHMYSTTFRLEYGDDIDSEGLEGKPEIVMRRENHAAFRDSAVVCAFGGTGYVTEHHERLFDADYEELNRIGGRIVELERHFNNKRGMDCADDILPYDIPDFDAALSGYYDLREGNADGTVPDSTVVEYATADD